MKFFGILILLALVMIAVDAYVPQIQKPNPNQKPFPTFPGQGPFNPRPQWPWRVRRSPDKNQISAHVEHSRRGTSWDVQAQHKIYENKYGNIHVSAGANQQPGGRPQAQAGIGASFLWR